SADAIDVAGSALEECTARSADCPQIYQDRVELMTYAVLVRDILDAPLANNRRAATDYVAMLDRRWTEYLAKARASYPWEMWLNDLATRGTYRSRGFIGPPTHQWLIAHPDAGLSYVDNVSDHLRTMVVLEALGYYRWSWGGNDQMRNAMGLAY